MKVKQLESISKNNLCSKFATFVIREKPSDLMVYSSHSATVQRRIVC